MDKIKIKEVTNEHAISAVEALAGEIWREHYIPIVGASQVEYMLRKFQSKQAIAKQIQAGFSYYLIVNETGNNIGYLGIAPKENELFLSKLYLTRDNRGKGYGKLAIKFVEKMARQKGLPMIALTVNKYNTGSVHAYQKCGFTLARDVVQDIGSGFVMDDYRMEKRLKL